MRVLSWLAMPSLALSACVGDLEEAGGGGRNAKAIVNGTLDPGDDNVVALLDHGSPFCSGTLVAPQVVVTAAHCVLGVQALGGVAAYFGANPDGQAGRTIAVVDGRAHPEATLDDLRGVDVAVLALAEPAPFAPKPMNDTPFDQGFTDRGLRLVGFGTDDPHGGGMGPKRQTITRVMSFTEADFDFGGTGTSACFGDSGGPAFMTIEGGEVLVGVTSGGDPDCTEGTYGRVDAHLDGFIRPFIAAHGGDAGDGTPGGDALPPSGGGCGEITYDGVCDGDVLSFCDEDGRFVSYACGGEGGASCGCDAQGFCDCQSVGDPPGPASDGQGDCGPIDYAGACDGDVLLWCNQGWLEVVDCAQLGAFCDWQDDTLGYNCL